MINVSKFAKILNISSVTLYNQINAGLYNDFIVIKNSGKQKKYLFDQAKALKYLNEFNEELRKFNMNR